MEADKERMKTDKGEDEKLEANIRKGPKIMETNRVAFINKARGEEHDGNRQRKMKTDKK